MDLLTAWLETDGVPWDSVRVLKVSGREAISELYAFDVDVVCDRRHELPKGAEPEQRVSLLFSLGDRVIRKVHGKVGAMRDLLDAPGDHKRYRLRIVPHHRALAVAEKQQVHLDVTAVEAALGVIALHRLDKHTDAKLLTTYPKREMIVQYAETDLALVSRLFEHLGISFFFDHDGARERMIFADAPEFFRPVTGAAEVAFKPRGESDAVFALELVTEPVPLVYIAHDASDRTPDARIIGMAKLDGPGVVGHVEHGTNLRNEDDAKAIARIRSEEGQCRAKIYEGQSGRPELVAGGRFTLLDHPRLAPREELLVVEVRHEATFPLSGATSAERPSYKNAFVAVPGDVVYRPARKTPRPHLAGVVTAIVQAGPKGQRPGVAKLDSEGRYVVTFHFDPARASELTKTSAPIRMAQPFAGNGYGMHFPLRPGTEVLVAFVNGDPDRPVIVGAVPNATSPSVVVDTDAYMHRIRSPGNTVIEFGPGVPRK